eukprot:7388610-Prymnesium_polylepis.1
MRHALALYGLSQRCSTARSLSDTNAILSGSVHRTQAKSENQRACGMWLAPGACVRMDGGGDKARLASAIAISMSTA